MKTCPRCGAENRKTASECRLCATRLESGEDLLVAREDTGFEEVAPGQIVSGVEPGHEHQEQHPGVVAAPAGGTLICPQCQATNDLDWVFCQQCGSRLPRPEPVQPAPQPPAPNVEHPPAAASVVPDQSQANVAPPPVDPGRSERPSQVSKRLPSAPRTSPERSMPEPLP